MNYYDFHSHILPGMDDGARDPAIAAQMVDMLREQGVCTIAATSHYISHRESPETFIGRRERALSALMQEIDGREAPRILPGAEIYLEKGVSEKDLSPLMIHGTRAILLELPREPYQGWILQEIEEIIYSLSAIPVMAHIERYAKHYRKSELEEILSLDGVVLQMNLSIFEDRSDMKLAYQLDKMGFPLLLGSDAHNLSGRAPNWDYLTQKLQKKPKLYSILNNAADTARQLLL